MTLKPIAVAAGLGAIFLCAAIVSVEAQSPEPAATQPTDARGQGRFSACRADLDTLCQNVERRGRWSCLEANEAKLSSDCKAALTRIKEARAKVNEACGTDQQALCADAEKGRSAMRCLRQNAEKLSSGCSEALAALPSRRRAPANADTPDAGATE